MLNIYFLVVLLVLICCTCCSEKHVHLVTHLDLQSEKERSCIIYSIHSFLVVSQNHYPNVVKIDRLTVTVVVFLGNENIEDHSGLLHELQQLNAYIIDVNESRGREKNIIKCIAHASKPFLFNKNQAVYVVSPTTIFFDSVVVMPEVWENQFFVAVYSSDHMCSHEMVIFNQHSMKNIFDEGDWDAFDVKMLDDQIPCSTTLALDSSGKSVNVSLPARAIISFDGEISFSINKDSLEKKCYLILHETIAMIFLRSIQGALKKFSMYCDMIRDVSMLALVGFELFGKVMRPDGVSRLSDENKKALRRQELLRREARGKFFLYDWPNKFSDPLLQYPELLNPESVGFNDSKTHSYIWEDYLLALNSSRANNIQNDGSGPHIGGKYNVSYLTDMHSLFDHLFKRGQVSSKRTRNIDEASAFLIPYDIAKDAPFGDKHRHDEGCELANEVRDLLLASPAFQRSGGLDHFVIVSTLLSNLVTHSRCFHFLQHFCRNCTIITIEDCFSAVIDPKSSTFDLKYRKDVFSRFFVVPYPTSLHLPPHWATPSWITDIAEIKKRTTPVTFIGSSWTSTEVPDRRFLKALCERHSPDCNWHEINATSMRSNIVDLYHESVFCLIPRGPTNSRKALLDSLLSGCVPVVFSVQTLHLLYPQFIDITTAMAMSVYFPYERIDDNRHSTENCSLIKWLVEIKDSEETFMKRHVISGVVKRLQFSLPILETNSSQGPDAFDVILSSIAGP